MTERRPLRLAALLALLCAALAGGCSSEERKTDEVQARRWKKEAIGTHMVAGLIAGEMADEAARLEAARKAGNAAQADASFQRLTDGRAVLEAIEDSENAFAFATRYYEVRQDLNLSPQYRARLDANITHMAETAGNIVGKRVPAFAPAPGKPCDPKVAEAIKKDLERDRAALRAWRVDVGLISQLGSGSSGE